MNTIHIAVIAFNGISPFHLSVPALVFAEQREGIDTPRFSLKVCGFESGPFGTCAGFDIQLHHGLEILAQADVIIMPSWRDPEERPPEPLLEALRRAHDKGTRIVGLCLGAFVLAEAGLLDGRKATTHWNWAAAFSRRYPLVLLDAAVLYAESDHLLTSAGTAASLDCCLYLMQQLCGAEVTHKVARQLVVAPHRSGGQAQFIERPIPVAGEHDRMGQLLQWLGQNFTRSHCLDELADRAAMSRRSFTRHFRQLTGTTVGHWLLGQRLSHAQRLLESSPHSIEAIALEAGFGTALSLRQHFNASLQISPSAYRAQFIGR
ncbi:AraC family transcriptional regulator [Pseudomonas agarici]|uniref:AraC family transcriptional regulator n=1 Tax=Pseudomonas agarici TaxID=46677 RepID=A0A0X1T1G9_PSEAA|nr:helix-turn-helix domain-containing protein [Pseudomonas agarici]AMB85914.1 AraC family transcriptional regulator [Pseudomonas agarici]NWB90679.1 helix-turn-helix domain-containing protein [Pseudomonas agarici]NWC07406.1 helix-turn-helix domain-containing protein [Pseudomonas agarici]SEK45537.1 Transcriptional regulator GlxA family, contains an amidase domain and an AraC-type DNA-binding HTH domain [Pseudomonas agarici]